MARRRPDWPYGALLAVLVFFLYFYRASAVGLVGPDEPRYAQVAREMLESRSFLTPHLLGRPWFEKPPLYYWLAAASFRLLGVNETAARLPAALSAAGFLILFAWIAARLFPGETARYALLILATTAGWIGFARAASMEMLFAASLSGAMGFLGLWLWQGRLPWLYAFYGLLGVSVLAKGLAGLVLSALTLLIYCAATREFRWLWRVLHPGPLLLFGVLALPWYGIMYLKHGRMFLEEFIFKHHFLRYLTPELAHPGPWWYYGPVLLAGLFPWTPGLALLRLYGKGDQRRVYLLAWVIVVVLFFSASQSKLPGYILPAIPALALWMGDEWSRASALRLRIVGLVQALLLPALGLAGSLPAALAAGLSRARPEFSGATAAFVAAALLVAWLSWRGRRFGAAALTATVTCGALLWMLSALAPAVDRAASARPVALAVCDRSFKLGTVRRHVRYGLEFYCNRAMMDTGEAVYVLSSEEVEHAVPVERFPEAGLALWKKE